MMAQPACVGQFDNMRASRLFVFTLHGFSRAVLLVVQMYAARSALRGSGHGQRTGVDRYEVAAFEQQHFMQLCFNPSHQRVVAGIPVVLVEEHGTSAAYKTCQALLSFPHPSLTSGKLTRFGRPGK
jgi:hypothetical protein